jgi:transposase
VEFVNRFEATTQTCCKCGFKQKISLNQRVFKCPNCGLEIDRDLNSAWNILKLGLKQLAKKNKAMADRLIVNLSAKAGRLTHKSALPVDCGKVTPVEWGLSPR